MNIADNRTRNRILVVLFIGVLMGALDIAIVAPALPAIKAAHPGVSARALAWVFTIYVLFNLIGTPLMAKLSDRAGRRSIYLLDVSLFAAGSLIVALSPTFGVLLLGRAVQGLGAGGIFPVASAVIGDTFPPEKRGSALGLIGAVFGLAFLIGPIIGGVVLMAASWRWLFLINLPIAAVVLILAARTLPASKPAQRKRFDLLGMVVLGLALAALTFGINQFDTKNIAASLASLNVWPFLLAAAVLLLVFYLVETRAEDPIVRMSLFASRQMKVVSGVALGAGLGESAVVFVPLLLVAAFGIKESTASYALLPAVLAMAVGSPVAGRMLDRFGSRLVILCGLSLLAAGMILVGVLPVTWVGFYGSALVVGLGLGMLLGAPLRYVVLNEAPATARAASQGALSLFTSSGQLIGGALVGAVAASLGGGVAGYKGAYIAVGVVALLLILVAVNLKSRAAEIETVKRNEAMRHAEAPAAAPIEAEPA